MHSGLQRLYGRLVESLSFSSELYKLRRELNARIDQPAAAVLDPRSHPLGVSRWFKRRRISIAEAYITVIHDLDSRHSRLRVRALKLMVDASFHAQTLDMPLNTARVQMALIKAAVRYRDDRRRQLELLQDFSASTHGQSQTIRALLDRLNLVELPENGKKLKDLHAGVDFHVHDTATSGRKNPTQLLIDAFIKGIGELTIAYSGISAMELMEEAVEAGRAVGIKVNIGIEIGLDFEGERFHLMALLPETRHADDLGRFFSEHRKLLHPLLSGLKEDQEGRVAAIRHLLSAFNRGPLMELNAGFPDKRAYRVPKLRMRDLAAFVPLENANRAHLGELLWRHYRPAMFNRVLYLKVQRGMALHDHRNGLISDWDLGIIESRYSQVRAEYREMNPEALKRRYFPDPTEAEHASAFDNLTKLTHLLTQAGCSLKLIQPLEHGFARAGRMLESGRGLIDQVEVYNVRDSIRRDPGEILRLCRLVNEINARSAGEGGPPFVPVCGSDATGRSRDVPGMGFIRADALNGKYRSRWVRRHVRLPRVVAALIDGGGKPVDLGALHAAGGDTQLDSSDLLCMGKISGPVENRLGDEEDGQTAKLPLSRALRYLNPALVNLVMTAIGFVVANQFIGPAYACLWLGITGSRNTLVDLLAYRGTRIRQWRFRSVNWRNVAQSLFWTGFSVPIMAFIKGRFDLLWPFAATGLFYNAVKFFFIAFANGLYIMSHNKLRGFDLSVRRANLFRTIISWPFASVFAPVGYSLGIPTIVQSKIWSDVVAGFIEGLGKYFRTLRLRRRDVEEMVPRIIEGKREDRAIAVFDLLYLFREEPRTRDSLRAALRASASTAESPSRLEQLAAVITDERLDRLLVNYAISMHGKEMAVELTRIISETLPIFRDWLSTLAHGHRRFEIPPGDRQPGATTRSAGPRPAESIQRP